MDGIRVFEPFPGGKRGKRGERGLSSEGVVVRVK